MDDAIEWAKYGIRFLETGDLNSALQYLETSIKTLKGTR